MNVDTTETAALSDIVPCGILAISTGGAIKFVNQTLCDLLGYEKSELTGQPVEKIFTVASKIFYQTHFFPLVKLHGKADEIFFSLRAKDSTTIPMIAAARYLEEQTYCTFLPVWQRKKYEEEILNAKRAAEQVIEKNEILNKLKETTELQLAESDRQLSLLRQFNKEYVELSKIIAHDLHEPIRKMLIHIDLLMTDQSLNMDTLHTNLRKMLSFSNRLRSLTDCLQQYVTVDTSKEEITKVDLNELIHELFDTISRAEGYNDATITVEQLPVIEGRRSQLKTLFMELLSNSFKFRKPSEPLTIAITSTEFRNNIYKEIKEKYRYIDFVRIEVIDNGIGFKSNLNEYIFEMFKKAHPEMEGAGFGLSLARKITERHNGSIYANCYENKTIFTILVPIKQRDFI